MQFARKLTRLAALAAACSGLAVSWARAADDSPATKETESKLIETLRSGAPAEKAIACKKLAIYGSKDSVPLLAPLLSDEHLSSWARTALEAIPDPAADEALRNAIPKLKGRLLIGTINSIGVRRDAAAVGQLAGQIKNQDEGVASAAAVALGKIGNADATKTLRAALPDTAGAIRNAVAEGCELCAERLLADGKSNEAADIYDEVRKAEVPKQKKLEATRGLILARKADGIPLLIEQLESPDKSYFNIGLTVARELPGREVSEALAAQLSHTTPERATLLLHALADRSEKAIPAAVLAAAKSGPKAVRIAAIGFIGRTGDVSSLSTLLDAAADSDAELAQAAEAALAGLHGEGIDSEIAARLAKAEGALLPVLIELVGQRRIDATAPLVKALDSSDDSVRHAALVALGETVGLKQLSVLIDQSINPKNAEDAETAQKALKVAAIRMADREACAAQLAAAIERAPAATKVKLLEILGAMGGPKALDTIAAAIKSNDDSLQDAGTRVLGAWMNVDAAPVLLDLAKGSAGDKYQSRAMRGYIRLARQFAKSSQQRAEMCETALATTNRPAEQKLVLAVLEGYPSIDTLRVAVNASANPELKQDAGRVALVIAQKIGGNSPEAQKLLSQIGLDTMKIEIVKAEYGAGETQKDVTEALKQHVHGFPLVSLPSPNYNESFGGDPAPNTPKQLKVQYRINGKAGEASFPENTAILLPMPK
jgi:HEAT repeat protein